ncbi:hypothetical protein [Candidatus Uabimicrobium amorphum]|uniref:Uncharacterized protein n=1 Tax=Uabimicrobium amorphum TaxID=2596890 RepID=A0A5S9II97_UABAM|nr:hypothetical protein [Candidatus Uabimicrobium amorphum]BBM82303.1 hypothetical protein UABAM_00646 [Candidatus Uabimicrobium amorphum]
MVDLQNEDKLICVYLAQTASQKILTNVLVQILPCYAVKLEGNKLFFHRVQMGKLINTIKNFSDTTFEIDIEEIESFKKNTRFVVIPYNIGFPRYKLKLKNGEEHLIIFPRMQKALVGKSRYDKELRQKIIDKLFHLPS